MLYEEVNVLSPENFDWNCTAGRCSVFAKVSFAFISMTHIWREGKRTHSEESGAEEGPNYETVVLRRDASLVYLHHLGSSLLRSQAVNAGGILTAQLREVHCRELPLSW